MTNKIYEFIKQTNTPISISEIQGYMNNVSRQEITKILQELNNQNLIYRSVIQGKAYYSINPSKVEGMNPVQNNIEKIKQQLTTNLTNNQELFDDEKNDSKIDTEIIMNLDEIKISKTTKKYQNKKYSFLIPDNFVIEEEYDNRDFVAYLRNPKTPDEDWELGGSNVIIYSSLETPYMGSLDNQFLPEIQLIGYDINYYSGTYYNFKKLMGESTYYKVILKNCEARVICNQSSFSNSYNYYFMCCIKDNYKQIHIEIDNVAAKEEKIRELAIEIMNGFKCEEDISTIKDANDKELLNEKSVDLWIQNLEKINQNLQVYYNVSTKAEELKNETLSKNENYTSVDFKQGISNALENCVKLFDKYLLQIEEYYNNIQTLNIKTDKLEELQKNIKKFIIDTKCYIVNKDEPDEIKRESVLADKIYTKLFNEKISEQKQETSQITPKKKIEYEYFISDIEKQIYRIERDLKETFQDIELDTRYNEVSSEYQLKVKINSIKRTINKYGDAFYDLVEKVDREGKQILDEGADYLFIKQINELLFTLNTKLDININFNKIEIYTTRVETYKYDIPPKAREIIKWWKDAYDTTPEVIKIKQEQQEAEQKRREDFAQKNKKIQDIINKELETESKHYQDEIKEIQKVKEEEIKAYGENKKAELLEKIEKQLKDKDSIIRNKEKEIEQYLKQIENHEQEISKLNIFQFLYKDTLKKHISEIKQKIEAIKQQINKVNLTTNEEIKQLNDKHNKDIHEYYKTTESLYLFPENPTTIVKEYKDYLNNNRCKTVISSTKYSEFEKNEIIETLRRVDVPITITEMQSASLILSKYSNQKLSLILTQMVNDELITRAVDRRKTYYTYNEYVSFRRKTQISLKDAKVNTKFAQDRTKIYSIIYKKKKDISIDDFIEYLKSYNISTLRLLQILKSLEEEKLITKNIKDNQVVYSIKK